MIFTALKLSVQVFIKDIKTNLQINDEFIHVIFLTTSFFSISYLEFSLKNLVSVKQNNKKYSNQIVKSYFIRQMAAHIYLNR